jgi:hypothetical protein
LPFFRNFKYNVSPLENLVYNTLVTVFSQDRQKKVADVLGLLKTNPQAVKALIEEMRLQLFV